MKYLKLTSFSLLILSLIFLFSSSVFAASNFNQVCSATTSTANNPISPTYSRGIQGQSPICTDNPTNNPLLGPGGTLTEVINVIAIIAGVAAVIMMIIGGIMFVTASGDSQRVNSAKNTIIYAIVGLVVIVLARFIIELIVGRIT